MALLEGLHDWVSMRELAGYASHGGAVELSHQLGIALLVLRELLDESLVEVGDLSAGYFTAWGVRGSEALNLVRMQLSGDVTPTTGLDIRLRNTPSGEELGRQVQSALDRGLWSWDT